MNLINWNKAYLDCLETVQLSVGPGVQMWVESVVGGYNLTDYNFLFYKHQINKKKLSLSLFRSQREDEACKAQANRLYGARSSVAPHDVPTSSSPVILPVPGTSDVNYLIE